MNTRSQIKRATLIGQRAIESLDAETQQALINLYQAQAADIRARIAAHAGADGNLALQELRSLLDQVEGILRRLSSERDAIVSEALAKAADYGARPALGAVLDSGAVVTTAASMAVSLEALRFVQTFIAEDGLQLSDRIWRIDRGARDKIVNALESAIIQGHGAGQAARELLARGEAVPADIANKLTAANATSLSATAREIMTGSGSPMDNAMRLMRTEINRAHGEAYMMGGANHPDFAGWRFLLSPAHPEPDICDLLSTQNLYGLGPGVYPDRERLPWPAHPNTLSFVETVFKDEITAADRAGKETPMDALARLTQAQREGVLGKGKAEIYDQGKLTQGMIRAPLKAVRERIDAMGQRDELTDQYFNDKVTVVAGDVRGFPGLIDDKAAIARLAGAPDGSTVTVKVGALGANTVSLVTRNPLFEWDSERIIFRDADTLTLMIQNEGMFLKPEYRKQGIGTRSLAIEATAAVEMGFSRIVTDALAGGFDGYAAWPRLGFNARLPDDLAAGLPAALQGAYSVLDLMQSKAGRDWWDAQKRELRMEFDLTPGSRSWDVLNAYLLKKGVRL